MFDKVLGLVAPHICCGCRKVGSILCEHCKDDIVNEPFSVCCGCLLPSTANLCDHCRERVPYQSVWVVGYRSDTLRHLIDLYKFERVMEAADVCARLLDARLPYFDATTTITYVPTASDHIRQRGYDHMVLVARRLAAIRKLPMSHVLGRSSGVSQRGASRAKRLTQLQSEFTVRTPVNQSILLLDDVYTTGATLQAAATTIRQTSEMPIYCAVIARQPLESTSHL